MPVAPWSWLDARADHPPPVEVAEHDDPAPELHDVAEAARAAAATLTEAAGIHASVLRRAGELACAVLRCLGRRP